MRRYPLSQQQPRFLLRFRDLKPKLFETETFSRLRISRELYCKTESDFRNESPSIPILLRNFDDISALYGNRFVSSRLVKLFGYHAALFLCHHFIDFSSFSESVPKASLGIEAHSFARARRMAHLRDAGQIVANFSRVLRQLVKPEQYKIYVMSNDTTITSQFRKQFPNVQIVTEDTNGLAALVHCSLFVGTYRSRLSNAVNMMRAVPGFLLNTDTGDLLNMSNSQAGVLSPFIQDVEDVEFTVNERLRGCKDNIQELRKVIDTFVL
jgi:hypothetical protein